MRRLFLALAVALLAAPSIETTAFPADRPEATAYRPAPTTSSRKPTSSGRPTARPPSEPSPRKPPVAAPASPSPQASPPVSRQPVAAPTPREPVHAPVPREPVGAPDIGEPTRETVREPVGPPERGEIGETAREPLSERMREEPEKRGLVARPDLVEPPMGRTRTRPFDGSTEVPTDLERDEARHHPDHRFDRPHHVVVHPDAHHPPPSAWYYHPCYSHWWVHPYYRWMHATIIFVDFPFVVMPWDVYWLPPVRSGWVWIPGQWYGPYWYPGHWEPIGPPMYSGYVYVPGFWWDDWYYEGYWRVHDRPGWVWVDTYYVDRRAYWGHWEPIETPRPGYVWEPGYWDGETWVEGFWRPESRVGFRWVSAAWDRYGVYHAGYWEPLEPVPGHVWIPGWFDGVKWIPGYWVSDSEYESADPKSWTPAPGWDAGIDDIGTGTTVEEGLLLAIPVP